MPSPASWLVFVAALFPAYVLAVLWHELGHCLASWSMGRPVMAWGIGARNPWFHARLGRTVFYLAQPWTLGLTIVAPPFPDRDHAVQAWRIAGGPLATIAAAIAGWTLWSTGLRSDVLLAWNFISTWLAINAAIPVRIQKGQLHVATDAYLIIDTLRGNRNGQRTPPGATLSTILVLVELAERLGAASAAAYFRLLQGTFEVVLGDLGAARDSLAAGQNYDSAEIPDAANLAAYLQALIAVECGDPQAPRYVDRANELCRDEFLKLALTGARFEHQLQETPQESSAAREQIEPFSRTVNPAQRWLVEVLLLVLDPPRDIDAGYRALLARHGNVLPPATRAHLLAALTLRLVERGEVETARRYFQSAQAAILEVSQSITVPATRETYLRQASRPLQQAVLQFTGDVPLFLAPPPLVRQTHYSRAALVASLASLSIALGLAITALSRPELLSHFLSAVAFGCVGGGWIFCMLMGLSSIFRGERQPLRVAASFAIGLLASIVAVAALLVAGPVPGASSEMPEVYEIDESEDGSSC